MAVLITRKYDKDSIKNEIALVRTTFSEVYGSSRAGNSHANSQKWAKTEFVRDFMPVLIICKFDKKNKNDKKWSRYYPDNIFPTIYLRETKKQVILM